MRQISFYQTVVKKYERIVLAVNSVGLLACFAAVFLVSADVVLRKLSGARLSIPGSNELSAYLLIVICMLSIPTLQVKHGHIRLDLFVRRFPAPIRQVCLSAVSFLECAASALLAWGAWIKAWRFLAASAVTDILEMPKWLFALVVFVGFAELTILFALETAGRLLNILPESEPPPLSSPIRREDDTLSDQLGDSTLFPASGGEGRERAGEHKESEKSHG